MTLKGSCLFSILLMGILHCQGQKSMMEEVSPQYLDTLIKIAKDSFPQYKVYQKQVGIAQNNLNKVKLSWFDGLGIYYLYLPPNGTGGGVNPTTNTNGFQLGFSLNVGSLLQKPAQINAARGQRDVARLEKEVYDLNLEAVVKERYFKYIQQVALLRQLTQLTVDAQSMLSSARTKFEKGQETFDNMSKAMVFYNQQNREKINVETDLMITKAQLEEILNQKLENIILTAPADQNQQLPAGRQPSNR